MLRAGKVAVLLVALAGASVHMTESHAVLGVVGVYECTSFESAVPTLLTLRPDGTAEEDDVWPDFELVSDPPSMTGTWERVDGQVRIVFPAALGIAWIIERCIYRLDIDGADLVLRSSFIGTVESEGRRGDRYVRVR